MTLTKDNYKSKQEIKWCPGCGDFAILASLQKTLPLLDIPKEKFAFISGIGCSGRLPYYLDVFGFHTLHGRAPTIATGLKLTRPDLSVWIVTGDGDGLSIGSNHLLHILRRNLDIKIIFINNKIYGLTKGQYSPTTDKGTITPTSLQGVFENPINPIAFALTAGATFVARAIDTDSESLKKILMAAAIHKGAAFIEIYQNCYIFNDSAFASVRDKKKQTENCLFVEHSSPLLYGANKNSGLVLKQLKFEKKILSNTIADKDIVIHDETNEMLAYLLTEINLPEFPLPFGIFKKINRPTFRNHAEDVPVSSPNLVTLYNQFISNKTK